MTAIEIEAWMQSHIAGLLKAPAEDVLIDEPFDHLGLDSASAIALIGELEELLSVEIDMSMAYDFPTIKSLAEALSLQAGARP